MFNIPNLITAGRLLLIAPILFFLFEEETLVAVIILLAFYSLDFVDGYLARRLNQVTRLGKNFDALADILFASSVILWGMKYGSFAQHIWFVFVANIILMGIIILFFIKQLKVWPELKHKKITALVFILFQILIILNLQSYFITIIFYAILLFIFFRNIDLLLQLKKLKIRQ